MTGSEAPARRAVNVSGLPGESVGLRGAQHQPTSLPAYPRSPP